ncbi:MAG: divergent polysaccharide deacetylase family protein [Rhodospirillaceae bacterium]|nr:divergent polysaccharide deacetylase family protein [Rhodospirillales bacterium]
MLMEPKRRFVDRPWVVPALMAAVLLAGLGIGIGVGVGVLGGKPERQARTAWEKAEMAVDRPPRREGQTVPLDASPAYTSPPFTPIVPLPAPRPGGPNDDGMVYDMPEGMEPDTEPTQPPPEQQAAVPLILPQPSVKPMLPNSPAWQRYAVPAPKTAGRPMIAVVIDDLGVDKRRSEKVTTLRAPLTLAWMTYAEDLPRSTQAAHQRGHELMLHVPMQPMGEGWDPGPDVLEVGVHPEENRRRLNWGLDRFDGFVGVNNHMGSRYTGDRTGMRVVMEELKKRGLLFLDSVTTDKSVAPELARNYGVPFAARQVFIDNEQSVTLVLAQLAKAEAYARKHGAAIAIGHPHDSTIEALSQWLPGLDAKGIVLVPVTAIVKAGGKVE